MTEEEKAIKALEAAVRKCGRNNMAVKVVYTTADGTNTTTLRSDNGK